jgi:prepilin-type N-terminal cleavage/methylation domain-containing protein
VGCRFLGRGPVADRRGLLGDSPPIAPAMTAHPKVPMPFHNVTSCTRPKAFTLLELLVVITIIVVLLALLTPALDRAIYSAELVSCATRLRAVVSGAQTYALQYQRHYPYRSGGDGNKGPYERFTVRDTVHDDRPELAEFLALNEHLNDPLAPGEIDIEGSLESSWVILPYDLYFGTRIAGHAAMFRIGDRWSWTVPGENNTWRLQRFTTLVSDYSWTTSASNGFASHPDSDGILQKDLRQDSTDSTGLFFRTTSPGLVTTTLTRWFQPGPQRGTVELNYGFADGAVLRFDQLRWNEPDLSSRMVGVPVDLNNHGNPSGGGAINVTNFRALVPPR